jgi:hypothetical protein
MTLRPDEGRPLGTDTGHSPDERVKGEGVPATEGTAADAAERTAEEPQLQAHRTDVEDSPTGHS